MIKGVEMLSWQEWLVEQRSRSKMFVEEVGLDRVLPNWAQRVVDDFLRFCNFKDEENRTSIFFWLGGFRVSTAGREVEGWKQVMLREIGACVNSFQYRARRQFRRVWYDTVPYAGLFDVTMKVTFTLLDDGGLGMKRRRLKKWERQQDGELLRGTFQDGRDIIVVVIDRSQFGRFENISSAQWDEMGRTLFVPLDQQAWKILKGFFPAGETT